MAMLQTPQLSSRLSLRRKREGKLLHLRPSSLLSILEGIIEGHLFVLSLLLSLLAFLGLLSAAASDADVGVVIVSVAVASVVVGSGKLVVAAKIGRRYGKVVVAAVGTDCDGAAGKRACASVHVWCRSGRLVVAACDFLECIVEGALFILSFLLPSLAMLGFLSVAANDADVGGVIVSVAVVNVVVVGSGKLVVAAKIGRRYGKVVVAAVGADCDGGGGF